MEKDDSRKVSTKDYIGWSVAIIAAIIIATKFFGFGTKPEMGTDNPLEDSITGDSVSVELTKPPQSDLVSIRISGRAVDYESGVGIIDVDVRLNNEKVTSSDAEGHFIYNGVISNKSSIVSISFNKLGYEQQEYQRRVYIKSKVLDLDNQQIELLRNDL